MMKKIINLTKIFCREYFLNLTIFNKKNILFWLIIIINIILGFLSQKCIGFLVDIGQEKIFLEIFFLILNIIIMSQTILSCTNIYYFSKDIECILPLPIKPIELLISKFNTILSMTYITELSFCTIPLLIYGLMTNNNLFYYFWLIIILIIFPIFIILLISTLMLVITKLLKFIKNKDNFQLVITIILILIFALFQINAFGKLSKNNVNFQIKDNNQNIIENNKLQNNNMTNVNNKITEINKYFLIINPCVEILNESNNLNCLINLIKITFIEIIELIIFIIIGKKLYLNNLIKNISKINLKKVKSKNKTNKYKKTNKNKKYIIQEFNSLIKNPTFLIQCIFPTIIVGILIGGLVIIIFPVILDMIRFEKQLQEIKIEFNIQIAIIILGIIQLIFIFSNISLTTITRKGKNAIFIKYIPMDFYKQFLLLNIPQILFNNISIIIILIIMKCLIPSINILGILILFILSNLLNIINSSILLIVDLKRPNLNWNNETSALKENSNKLFQYVLTIVIILLLIYLNKIFNNINFILAIILMIIIFITIISIINIYIKKNIKELFKKIN